jgi:hypothetical protein
LQPCEGIRVDLLAQAGDGAIDAAGGVNVE